MTYLAFDVDGTLFDISDVIVDAFQKGISRMSDFTEKRLQAPSRQRIVDVIGRPVDTIFSTLFPELDNNELIKINDLCTQCLVERIGNGGGSLIDGVYAGLQRMFNEGYQLLAASNGRAEYIRAIFNTSGISIFFKEPLITINEQIKDKTEIIKYYIDNLVGKGLIIMIGDRLSDRTAAEENNIPFIGCDFGHGGADELKGVRRVARDFSEIYGFIREIEREYA